MSAGNIVFLCIVVVGITLLGAVLAWASWMEGREQKRKSPRAQAGLNRRAIQDESVAAAHSVPKVLSRPF